LVPNADRQVGNGPPTVPPNGYRFRNGVALVSLLILETLYGSKAKVSVFIHELSGNGFVS